MAAPVEDLRQLAALAVRPEAFQELLEGVLGSLASVIPYDLAVMYALQGDELVVRAADGPLATAEVRHHSLTLKRFPTIRRALNTRRAIALTEDHHAGDEGDPYDGVLDLPHGHSCMVIPLYSREKSLGLITLDRRECVPYSRESAALADVYGQLVSLAMMFAEQASLLARYRAQLEQQNRLLVEEAGGASVACRRIETSRSSAMRHLSTLAQQVAASDLPVLIRGETGSGKEVLANAVHGWSPRVDGPFVKVNCAAIPENLVESELFGHVKGAFSGAVKERPGRFVTANGGTLLLDEIGDMPLAAQAKLLRVLQEGSFEPLGSDRTVRVDVRVIAASHVDLERAILDGRFREDLYYRLAAFPLDIPPLRERIEDVVILAEDILEQLKGRQGRGPWQLSRAAKQELESRPWPGNVRELANALERATIVQPSGVIEPVHLGPALGAGAKALLAANSAALDRVTAKPARVMSFEENERSHLERALSATHGKIYGPDGAAKLLGLKPTTLQSKLKKHGIQKGA
ncbi:MAG: sigma 54-interacting transcriptional regulator [Polyangiaceae bacterium]